MVLHALTILMIPTVRRLHTTISSMPSPLRGMLQATVSTVAKGNARERDKKCYMSYITAFEGARALGFDSSKYPRVLTGNIIPWTKATRGTRSTPCIQLEGDNTGFFRGLRQR